MIPSGDYRAAGRREHFVYRAYGSKGQLLYVGCTMRPEKRWAEHRFNSRWARTAKHFKLSGPYSYDSARRLEREALRDENPLHGMTPQKRAVKNRRDARSRRREALPRNEAAA